jgi:hypothetical protein
VTIVVSSSLTSDLGLIHNVISLSLQGWMTSHFTGIRLAIYEHIDGEEDS